jgi:hypothetical protein
VSRVFTVWSFALLLKEEPSAKASAGSQFFGFYLVPLLVGRVAFGFGFVSGQSSL